MVITLCGDVSVTQTNRHLWDNADASSAFGSVCDLFHSSDRVIVNLECALTEADTAIRKFGPNLKGPAKVANILKDAGVTDCGLSNNHIYDFSKPGLDDTLDALEKAGLNYTGIGANEEDSRKDLVIQQDGKTVRIITVCEHEYSYAMPDFVGARPYDPYDTAEDIRAAKANADYVVVMYHGGKEHCQYPSPRLRKLCRAMVTEGADLVLCQHSHCIGCYEEFDGCHILYGQGNFHFAKEKNKDIPGWNRCLAVFYDTAKNAVEFIPVTATENYGIRLMTGEEKEQELAEFAQRNQTLTDGSWKEGWHAFCESKRDVYTRMAERFATAEDKARGIQGFAHYLDCEAHTDVWRELFPTYNLTNEK